MTRKICVSAAICGSHICIVAPSVFDSIGVGPPSRPSTDTLSRQPSASIIGMALKPLLSCAYVIHASVWEEESIQEDGWPGQARPGHFGHDILRELNLTEPILRQACCGCLDLLAVERGQQAVDQRLRDTLIGHRLEQVGKFFGVQIGRYLRGFSQYLTQVPLEGAG